MRSMEKLQVPQPKRKAEIPGGSMSHHPRNCGGHLESQHDGEAPGPLGLRETMGDGRPHRPVYSPVPVGQYLEAHHGDHRCHRCLGTAKPQFGLHSPSSETHDMEVAPTTNTILDMAPLGHKHVQGGHGGPHCRLMENYEETQKNCTTSAPTSEQGQLSGFLTPYETILRLTSCWVSLSVVLLV